MRLSSTLLALAAVLAMTGTAQAANSVSGTANATVIAPISVSAGAPMNFGTISPSATDGTASSAGGTTGGVVQSGSFNNQDFTVTGATGETYSFSGSESSVTLTGSGGGTLIAALTYTSANPGAGVGEGTLAGGTDTLTANGVLAVPSTAVAGTYTGNYLVAVNYN
jgi:hypothetical protein